MSVRALAFDVFGTVVDWRARVIAQLEDFGRSHGVSADWAAFADAWRAGYGPSMDRVRHRLDPWPDSVAGLTRLKRRFVITPLSNGNVSLLTDMAKRAGLPWDCVISAELFRHYKPDAEVYRGCADLLGVAPGDLMLVAAHPSDLRAARDAGCVALTV